jgi:hypothetical protein
MMIELNEEQVNLIEYAISKINYNHGYKDVNGNYVGINELGQLKMSVLAKLDPDLWGDKK